MPTQTQAWTGISRSLLVGTVIAKGSRAWIAVASNRYDLPDGGGRYFEEHAMDSVAALSPQESFAHRSNSSRERTDSGFWDVRRDKTFAGDLAAVIALAVHRGLVASPDRKVRPIHASY